jgi:hypothetical protein
MPVEQIPQIADIGYLEESKLPELRLRKAVAEVAKEIQWTKVPLSEVSLEKQVEEGKFAMNPSLSWRDIRDMALEESEDGVLREVSGEQALAQLTRAGAQTVANGWYLATEVSWPEYVLEVGSNKRAEFYPPLHGSAFPSRTGRMQPYKVQRVLGLDRELINYKWMGGEEFDNELFEDDLTGQIGQRLQRLGEAMRVLEEAYVAGRLNGAAFTVGDDNYPASNYTDRNYLGTTISGPFSVNMYGTGEGNRLASFAQLSYDTFIEMYENLLNARDLQGKKMMVTPDILVVSTFDVMNADVLLESAYMSAIPGYRTETASTGTAGALRGTFSKNVIRNYVRQKAVNRYLRKGEWYVGQSNRGIIFQRRTPMTLVQEMPTAGKSYELDITRYRSRERFEVDYLDSRFWGQGNDGSVSPLKH